MSGMLLILIMRVTCGDGIFHEKEEAINLPL
jgi:hypothetical protein